MEKTGFLKVVVYVGGRTAMLSSVSGAPRDGQSLGCGKVMVPISQLP